MTIGPPAHRPGSCTREWTEMLVCPALQRLLFMLWGRLMRGGTGNPRLLRQGRVRHEEKPRRVLVELDRGGVGGGRL